MSIISLGAISAASVNFVIKTPSMDASQPASGRNTTHYPQASSTTSSTTSSGTTSNSLQPTQTNFSENSSITTRIQVYNVRTSTQQSNGANSEITTRTEVYDIRPSTQQSNGPNGEMSGPTPGPLPLAPVAIPPLSDCNLSR